MDQVRRFKDVRIVTGNADNRDEGKLFRITEMHARPAESWGDRAFVALAHSSINIPEGIVRRGMGGIAQLASMLGGLKYPELHELMDELLHNCVEIIPDPDGQPHFTRRLRDAGAQGDDIQEVATRQMLRQEAVELHTNFFLAGTVLSLISAVSEMRDIPGGLHAQMSLTQSQSLSRPVSRRSRNSKRSTA